MSRYSTEPRTRRYVKGYIYLSFARNLSNKYKNQLLDTGVNYLKSAFKKVVQKAAEAAGGFTGNKIADKIVKPKYILDENPRNVEEIIIPTGKREEILNKLRHVLQKWNTIKYLNY